MGTRADAWRARAITAINRFRAADVGGAGAHAYAYMAGACGNVYGWSHTWARTYLNTVYGLQNSVGGWGLGYSYDAFQDGSPNPPDCTYTVTLAGHVGPVLLDGYKAGAVPRAKVQGVIDLLMATPRIPVERGQCVAYSLDPSDCQPGYNVHNVNAGVGSFLHSANAAGLGATGMQALIVDISLHEMDAYEPITRWWPYMGTGLAQDTDHNSYSAESMYKFCYWVGREAAYHHMNNALADNAYSPIAHMRLASLPGGPGSWSRTTPGVTLWAEMADRWLPEIDAWIAAPPSPAPVRWAQAAYYCSRAAEVM